MSNQRVLMLNRSEVRATLDWTTVLHACRSALIDVASDQPLPAASVQLAVPGAALHLKAGAVSNPPVMSVKANLRPDAGSADGLIVAFDHAQARVSAILASTDLTAMRTAAIAAVALQELRQVERPTVGIVGAGPLARYFLEVLPEITPVAEVRVWSRHPERARELAQGRAIACDSIAQTVQGADVVLTCTPSRQALVQPEMLRDEVLILAMGADSPGKRELGAGVLEGAGIFADVLADACRVGELAHGTDDDRARAQALGARLAHKPDGSLPSRVVFDSVGSSTVDAAVVAASLQRAAQLGLGTNLDFSA